MRRTVGVPSMPGELTDRQRAVLGLVVKQYIETAQPVGSKTIVEQFGLGISPATIRNEMAFLEEHGYLTHPHTSAGRLPTVDGYRFFVEHFMGEARLPEEEQLMIRHQFHQAGLDLEQWAKLAATVLAHVVHGAALVTSPLVMRSRFKHLEMISIRDTMVLLVLVLQGGIVTQRMISFGQPVEQETLTMVSNRLNDLLAGLGTEQIAAKYLALDMLESEIRRLIVELMEENDQETRIEVYQHGLSHVLDEPEFAATKAGRQVIRALEEDRLLNSLSQDMDVPGGVQVIIGGEGRWHDLSDCSVVLSRYGWRDSVTGLLGVLGPMRMPYGRAISAVRYVSEVLSELVRTLYTGDNTPIGVEDLADRPL
jgi:heat-inducible transcriptional repressor